ncbi:competence damage-inducible protein A [Candidatus Bathyarchaeota archaeon]|nr:competence damage-inducible protein A [Candidatus Bathyarchaeota archaeon]
MACRVELLCIGNEILIGKTLNTNAHWLCQKVTGLGADVRRVTVVEDDVEAIGSALHEILGRRPELVLTTGGLGPTFDDKTLQAFSKAFNRPLRLNRHALKLVRSRYRRILGVKNPILSPPQLKMAKLPSGAKAISNPVGTAPAVTLVEGKVKFIILPGVPEELQSIFKRSVSAEIRKMVGRRFFYEASYLISGILESQVAPIIDQVMDRSMNVYVKSHVRVGEGRKCSSIELHFSSRAGYSRRAKYNVLRAIEMTTELLGELVFTRPCSRD